MEDYMRQMRENSSRGGRGSESASFLYGGGGSAAVGAPAATTNSSSISSSSCCSFLYANNNNNNGGTSSSEAIQPHHHFQHVKIETGMNPQIFHYPQPQPPPPPPSIISNNNLLHLQDASGSIKARIISHPHYSNLLQAYMDCQKVGAPPEVVARLTAVRQEYEAKQRANSMTTTDSCRQDPELDQFMEAYYDMLVKYREELTRPLQEAMEFMRRIEAQLAMLTTTSTSTSDLPPIFDHHRTHTRPDEKSEVNGSSEEEQENSGGETEVVPEVDPRAEDRELKNHLLRRYSGYLSSLKQELSKKKKKGKLPKDARQKLLSWWELHYKWPYPSESEKAALAESTGLDQKQINNWFINQRKRHWKPSEDMQFMVMDGLHPQNAAAALYMEAHYMGDAPYRFGP